MIPDDYIPPADTYAERERKRLENLGRKHGHPPKKAPELNEYQEYQYRRQQYREHPKDPRA